MKEEKLTVIVKSQELVAYVLDATSKSPKQFRSTFTERIQNWSTDVLQEVILANDVYINIRAFNENRYTVRRNHQHLALTRLKMLTFLAHEAMKHKSLTLKQYERIAVLAKDCRFLIGGWIKSDKKQYGVDW